MNATNNAANQAILNNVQQQLDSAEYICTVLRDGTVIYTESDDLVLDFGNDY